MIEDRGNLLDSFHQLRLLHIQLLPAKARAVWLCWKHQRHGQGGRPIRRCQRAWSARCRSGLRSVYVVNRFLRVKKAAAATSPGGYSRTYCPWILTHRSSALLQFVSSRIPQEPLLFQLPRGDHAVQLEDILSVPRPTDQDIHVAVSGHWELLRAGPNKVAFRSWPELTKSGQLVEDVDGAAGIQNHGVLQRVI